MYTERDFTVLKNVPTEHMFVLSAHFVALMTISISMGMYALGY